MPPSNGLGFELHRLVWMVDVKATALLQPYGLTHAQFRIMRTISVLAPITGKDLARSMFVTPSSMSKAVARLVTAGYVHDTQRPGVGNIQQLSLTEEGARILTPLARAMDAAMDEATRKAGLDPEQLTLDLHRLAGEVEHITTSLR